MKLSVIYQLFFLGIFLNGTAAYSQNWENVFMPTGNSDTIAVYRWTANDDHHGAFGEIVLLKSGRFAYNSERPLASHEYTEGFYAFKKDTLILNSDFQPGNLSIKIEYSDTSMQHRRLSFAYNLNGVPLWKARYFFNNDTSIAAGYYADFPIDAYPKDFLTNIKTLKIEVSPGIGSPWVPVRENAKFIKVTVLSGKNFNEYHPKVLTDYKFLLRENKLADLTGGL